MDKTIKILVLFLALLIIGSIIYYNVAPHPTYNGSPSERASIHEKYERAKDAYRYSY